MAQILPFGRPGAALDANTAAVLIKAYDLAIEGVRERPAIVREFLAKQIIAHAAQGERDPVALSFAALSELAKL